MKSINLSFAQMVILTILCVILGAVSVGYVAAQTASSTEEAATSAVETSEPTGEVAGEATTTEGEAVAPEVVEESTSAPETVEEAAPTESAPQEAISATATAVAEVSGLEQEYMSKYGRYLQVMPGNTLPSYESGSVQAKFGKTIPESVRIDVYESPHGKGYQIMYEENGVFHSVGYGPEAFDRTYTIEPPAPTAASSTPAVQ